MPFFGNTARKGSSYARRSSDRLPERSIQRQTAPHQKRRAGAGPGHQRHGPPEIGEQAPPKGRPHLQRQGRLLLRQERRRHPPHHPPAEGHDQGPPGRRGRAGGGAG